MVFKLFFVSVLHRSFLLIGIFISAEQDLLPLFSVLFLAQIQLTDDNNSCVACSGAFKFAWTCLHMKGKLTKFTNRSTD